ncbi:MAG: methyltransferase domain-containing protein [Gammaproteobacteria bacterium]|nr:methyltransferase domain-containing protein [Gammaproteobacteria bacterium]
MSEGLRLKPHFLSAWLRNPLQMGAVVPSSDGLAWAMARQLPLNPGRTLELGAGTGAVTRALLARGVASQDLLSIEKDPALARELGRKFPTLRVLTGDAARLTGLLEASHFLPVDTVVSSLPLLSMRNWTRTRILSQVFAVLAPGGQLIQFTYSPRPPIPETLVAALGLEGERVQRVLWNLPPASVWVYRQTPHGHPGHGVQALLAAVNH